MQKKAFLRQGKTKTLGKGRHCLQKMEVGSVGVGPGLECSGLHIKAWSVVLHPLLLHGTNMVPETTMMTETTMVTDNIMVTDTTNVTYITLMADCNGD